MKLYTSEIHGEMLQNLPYFWNKKTQLVFPFFISSNFGFVTVDAKVYVDQQGIHCYKFKIIRNEKWEKKSI